MVATTTSTTNTTIQGTVRQGSGASSTGLIAGVVAAAGTVAIAVVTYLTWTFVRQSRLKRLAQNGLKQMAPNGALMAIKNAQDDAETPNPVYEQAQAAYQTIQRVVGSAADSSDVDDYLHPVRYNPLYDGTPQQSGLIYMDPDVEPDSAFGFQFKLADYDTLAAPADGYLDVNADYVESTQMGASDYLQPVKQAVQAVYVTASSVARGLVAKTSDGSPNSSGVSENRWSSDYETGEGLAGSVPAPVKDWGPDYDIAQQFYDTIQ